MKKLTFILILTTITAHAQMSFGVKGGVNFANQTVVNSGLTQLPETLTSFHGGVYMHARIGRIGIQPEILYSRLGGKLDGPLASGSIITDYFSIPLLVTYPISKGISVHLGPQLGILNMAKETLNGTKDDIRYLIKTGDFGIAAGFSVDLPRGFQIGIRYIAGLRDIKNGNYGNPGSYTHNNVLQVYAGFRLFNFKVTPIERSN